MHNLYDIQRMAREAGWTEYSVRQSHELERLVHFTAIVAAAEREACAQLAENGLLGLTIAKAIRARGEK